NGRVCEHVIMVSGRLYPWELPLELPAALGLQLGNHAHLRSGELIEIADEFRSPVPTANDTNAHRSHRAFPFRCSPLTWRVVLNGGATQGRHPHAIRQGL